MFIISYAVFCFQQNFKVFYWKVLTKEINYVNIVMLKKFSGVFFIYVHFFPKTALRDEGCFWFTSERCKPKVIGNKFVCYGRE